MKKTDIAQEQSTSKRFDGVKRSVEWLFAVEPKWFDLLFTLGLLTFIGSLIVMSRDLRPVARLVPIVVAVPTFFTLCVIVLMLLSERVSTFADRFTDSTLLGVDDEEIAPGDEDEHEVEDEDRTHLLYEKRKKEMMAFSMVLSLLLLVYLVGFMGAIPFFLLVLYRTWAKQSWFISIVTAALVWIFVLVTFYVLLGVRLYTGIFDINLIDYFPL